VDGFQVLYNMQRSLSRYGIPRIGQPLSLLLRGTPTGAYLMLASPFLAPRANPPPGYRHVDLVRHTVEEVGFLDAQGRAEHRFLVPRAAALVGTRLHWQALFTQRLHWSNLESTTLVDF